MTCCPYCGAFAANPQEEIRHMNTVHPEIVEQRLIKAGYQRDENGKWIDRLSSED